MMMNEGNPNTQHTFHFSALAKKHCVGKGLEIGGSAHNPFGLDTLNVDYCGSCETIFKEEELRMCGNIMPVDIVARGDNVPLPASSQDFIVSSHVFEHFPDPIRALVEWDRLVKPGGVIFIIVPHMERTFDKCQPRTTLLHLIDDFSMGSKQCDFDPHKHYHHWITEDIVELCNWMIQNLGMRWQVVEIQDVDDKVGNGFTIVIRKEAACQLVNIPHLATMPRAVLFVVHGFPPAAVGGVEVYTLNLAREMASLGVSITVLYPVTDSSEHAYTITSDIIDGLTIAKFHVPRGNLFTSVISQEIDSAFAAFLKSHSFNNIHFHHIFENLSLSMIATAKAIGVPVSITLHDFWFICPRAQLFIEENNSVCTGPESPDKCAHCVCCMGWCSGISQTAVKSVIEIRLAYVREQLLKVDLLFAPSDFVADIFRKYSFGGNRITVAPLGIGKFAARHSVSETGPRFGYMGTIHPVKNIVPLVKAFATTHGQARLDIYGGGEPPRIIELKNSISDPRITYFGSYAFEHLPEILSHIDVLIVPSLIESYCFTVREALTSDIPVLAARVGGIPEIICNGVNGILFDPYNNQELGHLLQQIINDKNLLLRLQGNAIPVQTISADATFLLEQYTYHINPSESHIINSKTAAVERVLPPQMDSAGTESVKIKVAVFSLDHHEQACGHYRIYAPFQYLDYSIEVLQGILIKDSEYTIKQEVASAADLIVVQRFMPRPNTTEFLDWLCSLGKPVIFEIDDLLTKLPPSNPSYDWGMDSAPYIYDFVKKCSAVTVSTEELQKRFSPYNDIVYVLPNMLDTNLWRKSCPPSSGSVVIGYAGTITHNTDLELLEDVLGRIALLYGNKVTFTFMGCATARIAQLPGFSYIQFETTFEAYARKLQEISIDIMLVPLEDNTFNRCKSNIKWLEYSACGIAGIYADLPPYNTSVVHGKTGLLVGSDPEQWFKAISLLVERPELRHAIAENARAEVLAKHTVASGAHRWLAAYREIMAKHSLQTPKITSEPPPRFSIIVLTWNRARMLEKCLASLFSNLSNRDECEIIIGDNGSSDDTASVIDRFSVDARVCFSTNQGINGYRELFDRARGEFIICIDDDVLELPPSFERCFDEYFAAYPDYGMLGLDVVQNEHTNGAKPGREYYHATDIRGSKAIEEGYVIGCCFCVRKELFNSVGGFGDVALTVRIAHDASLYRHITAAGQRTGIISGVRCFHANGPYYSAEYGYIDQDIEKYRIAGLTDMVEQYANHKAQHTSSRTSQRVKLSVIIPIFNQVAFTRQCLETLFATLPPELSCEIIVVDNASSDGTGEYLRSQAGRITVLTNKENGGFAVSCNQGAHAARGELILFLNNDTIPQPGWIEPLITAVGDGGGDICGARLLYPDGRCQHAGIAFDERGLGYHIFGGFPGDADPVMERRWMQAVTGACMVMKKTLFIELGGFDDGFRNGFEDVDFCLRAGRMGTRILYVPESTVIHYAEQSLGRKDNDRTNMQRFFTRWNGKIRQDDADLYARFGLVCKRDTDGRIIVTPAASRPPLVSIIIPLFNKVELTRACLLSLVTNTAQGSYELLLVDNGSTDGTNDLLRQWESKATVIRNPENRGFAAACNLGARAAAGKYLLFLNNDTEVTTGWLEPLVAALEGDLSVAAVGSKLLFPDGTIQHAGVMIVEDQASNDPLVGKHHFFRFPGNHPQANSPMQMQAVTAACVLIRRTAFEAVGGFDEGYWNGYEDLDLCFKLGSHGWKIVYQPASIVIHHESQSGTERFRRAQDNIRRLHDRWLGKIKPDLIIMPDTMVLDGSGILTGVTGTYRLSEALPQAVPAAPAPISAATVATSPHYPLIPLVGKSASSILQKLSSSQKTKGVLKRYTVED
jgi:GT2 family glycosyltransferase/glycosyltransferase involved in cell wall biosynthesis